MRPKHNKKRNTAFVYESLVKEATVAILKNDYERRDKVVNIIKKHFNRDSLLRKDLEIYQSLYENQSLDKNTSTRILTEAKLASRLLDTEGIFVKQSDLINDVNTELSPSIFNNFVPNYKTLASISQIFSGKLSPKQTVILENQLIDAMCAESTLNESEVPNDSLVYKTLVSKFNDKYDGDLLKEQKQILSYFISSFADNSLELKMFLNEEISRLKKSLNEALQASEISDDQLMFEKTKKVIAKLDELYTEEINEKVLLTVLKTQTLVGEINNDGNHS